MSSSKLNIIVIEPTWNGETHLPANLGLLRIVCGAYPGAKVNFLGGESQVSLIQNIAPIDTLERVNFISWDPATDRDTLPADVYLAVKKLRHLELNSYDLIVLSSCTATVLSALCFLGLATKTCAMLHGNANDVGGWRSRNPFRRFFDLTASLTRLCKLGGKVAVLEDRIQHQLAQQNTWLADSLIVVPHPLLPEEARPVGSYKSLTLPIKIGFAGAASKAKGFAEFVEFAQVLDHKRPGIFEFHAFGKLRTELANLDQSVLKTPASDALARTDYINGLNSLHYLFLWHQDDYYDNAASGVVYDAINLGIPMIARRCGQISDWHDSGLNVADIFNDLNAAINHSVSLDFELEQKNYKQRCVSLEKLRDDLSYSKLSKKLSDYFTM